MAAIFCQRARRVIGVEADRVPVGTQNTVAVGIFDSRSGAETAVKELKPSGFDMKRLFIFGKDHHTEEHVIGFYNWADRMERAPSTSKRLAIRSSTDGSDRRQAFR